MRFSSTFTGYGMYSIIMYGSRVNETIQGKELHPPLQICVLAMENEAFSFVYCRHLYIYLYIYKENTSNSIQLFRLLSQS